MATEQVHECPSCRRVLTYVKEGPTEFRSSGDKIIGKLASDIFRCDEHGLFRIYISGAVEKYREP
jgi:hypothetical protein